MKKQKLFYTFLVAMTLIPLSSIAKENEQSNFKFYGYIKTIAKDKVGIWKIGNKQIKVEKNTKLEKKNGDIKVGAYAEVKGKIINNNFVADEIETKKSSEESEKEGEE